MNPMTGITVVIPTYNRARLLQKTLESIARVRRPADGPLEVLVINNNSTDDTPAIVEAFASRCAFPVRLLAEPRQGLGHASPWPR